MADRDGDVSMVDTPKIETASQGGPTEASGALPISLPERQLKEPTPDVITPSIEVPPLVTGGAVTPSAQLENETTAAIAAGDILAETGEKSTTTNPLSSTKPTPASKSKRRSQTRTPVQTPRVNKRRSTSRQLSPSLPTAPATAIATIIETAEPLVPDEPKSTSLFPALAELVPSSLQKIIGQDVTPQAPNP